MTPEEQTIKDIQHVMEQEPLVTIFGMQDPDHPDYQSGRASLLKETKMFADTVSWLSQIKKIKSINTMAASYHLKHVAEREIGYITNGAFIAAAIHCGFQYKRCGKKNPNVHFNMSQRSLNKKYN